MDVIGKVLAFSCHCFRRVEEERAFFSGDGLRRLFRQLECTNETVTGESGVAVPDPSSFFVAVQVTG